MLDWLDRRGGVHPKGIRNHELGKCGESPSRAPAAMTGL
jgi:hypothetical protein